MNIIQYTEFISTAGILLSAMYFITRLYRAHKWTNEAVATVIEKTGDADWHVPVVSRMRTYYTYTFIDSLGMSINTLVLIAIRFGA